MCARKLPLVLGVLLAAVSGFAAWAYIQYRDAQEELDALRKQPRVVVNQIVLPDPTDEIAPMPRESPVVIEVAPMPQEYDPDPLRIVGHDPLKIAEASLTDPAADRNAAAHKALDEAIRRKLGAFRSLPDEIRQHLPFGYSAKPPADATASRSMRWTLRFKVTSGRDYLDQLNATGAKLAFAVPKSEKILLFPDLAKLDVHREATVADLRELSRKLQFADARSGVVGDVARVLELEWKPMVMFAFFPKPFEEELAQKELAYRNRRVEDIEQTVFSVTVRDGKAEIVVVEQKVQR